jgi:hypothetical protein
MDNNNKNTKDQRKDDLYYNRIQEGNDKAPGEEKGQAEKVTNKDLKGKKNDGDPSKKEDQPAK